jgi:ABC-type transport system involved in cytochrome bd biosynthesis fused ATPase/permease subunit
MEQENCRIVTNVPNTDASTHALATTKLTPPHAEISPKDNLRLAKAVGATSALVFLASSVLFANGLRQLVQGSTSRAFELLGIFAMTRGLVTFLMEEFVSRAARTYRARWHAASGFRLASSTPEEIHSLGTAIDHLSAAPGLAVVQYGACAALAGIAVIFFLGGWLCVLIVVALIGLSIPAYISAGRATVRSMEDFHRRRSASVARQLRLLRSITDLRALGAVEFGANEIAAASNSENRAVLAGVRVAIRSTLVTEFLSGVSVGLVAMVVGLRLWHHSIALGPALGAVLVTAEMYGLLRRYGSEFHRRDDAATARQQLNIRHASREICDGPLLELDAVATAAPAQPVSLRLEQQTRIRLLGLSGVGKSSLIDTALGLREPIAGKVRTAEHRTALIRTDNHFVGVSLRENLALGVTIADDEILDVLTSLGLTDSRFRQLDSVVLEDARDFSTGERIQLAIARGLLAQPVLLVFDDVAGSLDGTTRQTVSARLDRFPGAVIEAGHDVFLVSRVDQVIEMVAQ